MPRVSKIWGYRGRSVWSSCFAHWGGMIVLPTSTGNRAEDKPASKVSEWNHKNTLKTKLSTER